MSPLPAFTSSLPPEAPPSPACTDILPPSPASEAPDASEMSPAIPDTASPTATQMPLPESPFIASPVVRATPPLVAVEAYIASVLTISPLSKIQPPSATPEPVDSKISPLFLAFELVMSEIEPLLPLAAAPLCTRMSPLSPKMRAPSVSKWRRLGAAFVVSAREPDSEDVDSPIEYRS